MNFLIHILLAVLINLSYILVCLTLDRLIKQIGNATFIYIAINKIIYSTEL